MCKLSQYFLPSFESIGLLAKVKKPKTDCQDVGHGSHLGFQIETVSAIFNLQVDPILPTKFQVNWPIHSGKKLKIDFQDGGQGSHLGFLFGTMLAIFYLQVVMILPTKFRVIWSLIQEKKYKIYFQDGASGHLGFPIGTILREII